MIVFEASGRRATAKTDEPVTSHSVGIPIKVALSADFDDLQPILTFECGDSRADLAVTGDALTVPPQLLYESGRTLYIGVYATNASGEVVIPTIWATCARVERGSMPSGIDPAKPTPSWAAQVQQTASEAKEMARGAADVAEDMAEYLKTVNYNRVSSLDDSDLTVGAIDVVGTPAYVADVTEYTTYGLTDPGWYVFARITAPDGVAMDGTTVTGAAGYVVGSSHVDMAVAFEVAAMSQAVTVTWAPDVAETFVFKATDLAIRNLDYRTTFYVYDLAPYTSWEWEEATGAFVGTEYWEVDEEADIGHSRAAVITGQPIPAETYYTRSYALTTDATFQEGTVYYTKAGTVYTPAEVTSGAAVTANTYYVDVWTEAKGFFVGTKVYHTKDGDTYTPVAVVAGETAPAYYVDAYDLTTDETFVEGTTYYTLSDGVYTAAEVTAGEPIPAGTYYVHSYELVEGGTFADGVTYYTKSGTTYTAAEVTAGEDVPDLYWQHSRLTIEGQVRNVTYQLGTPIDCPSVFVLPEIEDDTHGCWFEMRFRHLGSFSSTLQPPDGVKVATEHTQAETAGINMVDLHYNSVSDVKVWRFMNTHSTLPA